MSSRERAVATTVILFVAGSLLVPIATAREYWPFLYYQMYATPRSLATPFAQLQVRGVPRDESLPDFFLKDEAWIHPFRNARLQPGLFQIMLDHAEEPERIREAVDYLFERYEQRRKAGLHDGPELKGLKVQLVEWKKLDPWARTVATPDRVLTLVIHPPGLP